jgi:DNA repair exonuclease SbcCD nuclease subunit
MRIALITDTHAGARNDSSIFNEYFLNFFENQFLPYLEENNIKKIIHLGDVFDRRKYINFYTLNSWKQRVFDVMRDKNIQMDVIIGNHDAFWKNTNQINSVRELLYQYDNISVYENPYEIEIDSIKFLYIPWVNSENQEESIRMIQNTSAEIMLGHIEIKGFQMHRGSLNLDRGFEVSDFKKFDYAMSGHFHHKSNEGHIYYLGSPYEMTWSDWGDKRGFHIFHTETRKLEFIENHSKIFHKIIYDDANKTLEEVLNHDFKKYTNMFVKVVVSEKTNAYFFDSFVDKLHEYNLHDLKIVEKIDDNEINSVDETLSSKDTLTIIQEHISELNIEIDKKKLSDIINELYIEASNLDIE